MLIITFVRFANLKLEFPSIKTNSVFNLFTIFDYPYITTILYELSNKNMLK